MSIKARDVTNITFWIMLYLASMNFMAKYFYFIFAIFALYCLLQKVLHVDVAFFMYLALGIIMAIYCYDDGYLAMLRSLGAPVAYLIGYNLCQNDSFEFHADDIVQKKGYMILSAIA